MMRSICCRSDGRNGKAAGARLVQAGHEVHGMTRTEGSRSFCVSWVRCRSSQTRWTPSRWRRRWAGLAGGGDPPADGDRAARPAPFRPVFGSLTGCGPGDRPSVVRQPGRGRNPVCRAKLFGAYDRTGGPVKCEADPFGTAPAKGMRERWGDPPRRGGCARCAVDAGSGVALRRFLRPGHLDRARRRADGGRPQAQVPVVGDGAGSGRSSISPTPPTPQWRRSSAAAAACTTSSTTTPHPSRYGCRSSPTGWCAQPAAGAALRRPAVHRRGRRRDDDGAARCLQRQGQAGARLEPGPPQLA